MPERRWSNAHAVPAVACAAALAALWVLLAPRTADLAAQVYRVQLFAREGFSVWDNNWFGGHDLLGYSLVFPALAATFGPVLIGVASVLASSVLFARLLGPAAPGRRLATCWFACAAAGDLFIGRLTFALGVSLALACLLAVARKRPAVACLFGLLSAGASPVSGLLLALVLLAWMPPLPRWWRVAVLAAPPGTALALSLAFPDGGTQPYALAAALVAIAITLAGAAVLPPALRALRRGALLYAGAIALSFLIPSPMGSNVARLGVLAAGPALVLAVRHRPSRPPLHVAIALALAIVAWQLWAPVSEVVRADESDATTAAYFAPLVQRLGSLPAGRVEVVPTSTRWESVYVARHDALARGWETQLDKRYDALFYRPTLDPVAYLGWLRDLAVSYVAVSDGPKERWGRSEARLLADPPPALRLIWHNAHWRLFAVSGARPLVSGARLVSITTDTVAIAASHPGTVTIRVRHTPYWTSTPAACVTATAGGFTRLRVVRPGRYTLRARFTAGALLDQQPEACEPASPSR